MAEVVPDVMAQVMVMTEQEASRDEDEAGQRDGNEYDHGRLLHETSVRESPPSP